MVNILAPQPAASGRKVGLVDGLEPSNLGSEPRCLIPRHEREEVVSCDGFEPPSTGSEPAVLPLNEQPVSW